MKVPYHTAILNIYQAAIVAIHSVKMRGIVVAVIHCDPYSPEKRYFRHDFPHFPPLPEYVQAAWLPPVRPDACPALLIPFHPIAGAIFCTVRIVSPLSTHYICFLVTFQHYIGNKTVKST